MCTERFARRHKGAARLMCIAIYKPEGLVSPEKNLAESFRCNKDGAGFALWDGKKVTISKGFFTYQQFLDAWKAVSQAENTKALVHFRVATHGTIDTDNCHPFQLKDGALIHNGIISGCGYRSTSWNSYED